VVPDIATFRACYRRTFVDWACSFLRRRFPLEPCRLYHSWEVVYVTFNYIYQECSDCAARRMRPNVSTTFVHIDDLNEDWLLYKQIEFVRPRRW
jgi:hypothetical protein